jgi:serine acetyltransferase
MILIGYSGHAFVVYGILRSAGLPVTGYCDVAEKEYNPFKLPYFGSENSETAFKALKQNGFFIAIGDNRLRVMIAANATINPLATVGTGAICNTGCIIEHECVVGEFAHIGPGAVLCGNVKIGDGTFVGANAVIKQGITVGKNAMIGAGAVVVKDVPDGVTVVGVPAK